MTPALTAADIMTRDVRSVAPGTTLAAAVGLMLDHRLSGLPVVDAKGAVVGVVTEGDLLRRVELGTEGHPGRWREFVLGPRRLEADYVATHSRTVDDVMTTPVLSVAETAPLSEVVALMQDNHVKRVPVLAAGLLVGVVSRADLLRALADSFARSDAGAETSDAAIRLGVEAELGRQHWAETGSIRVAVADRVVTLEGTIFDESERAALRVAAENVAGVASVRDRLTWVEPNSGFTYTPP